MAASGSDQYQQQYNQYQQQQQQYQQQQQAQQQVQQQQQYQQQTAQPDESIQQWKTWQAHEAQSNGISMTWNVWPASRLEATRCVVPFAAMYTPLHNVDSPSMALVNQEPLVCHRRECRALMNPYCQADYQHKFWVCNFCQTRNAMPQHYSMYTPENAPPETRHTTIEYGLQSVPVMPPVFLFVVDTCLDDDELASLKETLSQALANVPSNGLVGLITYGRTVQVHELGAAFMPRCYVFRGAKDLTAKQVQQMLGIGTQSVPSTGAPGHAAQPAHAASRFIQPYGNCEADFLRLIGDIQRDPWHTPTAKRRLRCAGAALSVAISMLEVTYPNTGARVELFLGGPCTQGPGQVVSDDLKLPIRSHNDIEKDNARYLKKATKFFESLSNRCAKNGHCVDIFSCALDQTGLLEMKSLTNFTGGTILLADSFTGNLFRNSLLQYFLRSPERDVGMALCGTIELKCSQDVKLSGCIGHCYSGNQRSPAVSDNELLGTGGTCKWKLNGLTRDSTYAFFFEIARQHGSQVAPGASLSIQFITQYQHVSGMRRVRCTTVQRPWAEPSSPYISMAFDEMTAAAVLARVVVFRVESGDPPDEVQRWIDRNLIRLCQKIGFYTAGEPSSFQLPPSCRAFPKFIFHLRRSPFLQVFNNSPDETTFYRSCLIHELSTSCLLMVYPTLWSFACGQPPELVELDSTSLAPDRVLLLDTFFHVLIYAGETVTAWRRAGYHESGEYPALTEQLAEPNRQAHEILRRRFPCPRYIQTEAGGSQARFLLSKVNPSKSHNTPSAAAMAGGYGAAPGGAPLTGAVLTDDVNYETFYEHLRKLAVSQSS